MKRKGVYIIYNVSLGSVIEELLDSCGIEEFTIIPGVLGSGKAGGKRFNNEIYPGINHMAFIVTDQKHFKSFQTCVHKVYEEYKRDGITYFSFNIDEHHDPAFNGEGESCPTEEKPKKK